MQNVPRLHESGKREITEDQATGVDCPATGDSPMLVHPDGGLTEDRAFGFADAAADAEFQIHMGLSEGHGPAGPVFHPQRPQARSPFAGWGRPPGRRCRGLHARKRRQRPLSIMAVPIRTRCLFLQGKFSNRACRADLPAEGAPVFAVADPGYENRRPDPVQSASSRVGWRPPVMQTFMHCPHLMLSFQKLRFFREPGGRINRGSAAPAFFSGETLNRGRRPDR
jgi:hypothetical protein